VGRFKSAIQKNGKNVVLSFEEATVQWGDRILFRPEWGTYDLICGEGVVSVFGGAADRAAYLAGIGGHTQKPREPKTNLTEENRELNLLYAKVRELREKNSADLSTLTQIHSTLESKYPMDWLLRLELLEVLSRTKLKADWVAQLRSRLKEIAVTRKDRAEMIARGLEVIDRG